MNNMDEIVKLHRDRMRSLEKCFQGEVKKLRDDFEKEKSKASGSAPAPGPWPASMGRSSSASSCPRDPFE